MSLIICVEGAEFIPPGLYIAINSKLHQPWRLYPDDLGAFTTTVMPDDQSRKDESSTTRFRKFQSVPFTGANAAVPVPSQLYLHVLSVQLVVVVVFLSLFQRKHRPGLTVIFAKLLPDRA